MQNQTWKPEDDRKNPDYLWPYLERLFPRVVAKVKDLTEGWGPRFHTGSVMGAYDLKHDSDSGDDAPVFDLYVALIEFLGANGIGSSLPANRDKLKRALVRSKMTDAEVVLGRDGRLEAARQHARFLLTRMQGLEGARHMKEGAERCYELMVVLRDFATSACVHEFVPMAGGEALGAYECAKCELPRTMEAV